MADEDRAAARAEPPPSPRSTPSAGSYRPHTAPGVTYHGTKPDTYMVWAVLSLLFCCLPFGIVALVFASQVDALWTSGRQAEAIAMSKKAKSWVLAAVFSGLGLTVLYVAVMALAAPTPKRR